MAQNSKHDSALDGSKWPFKLKEERRMEDSRENKLNIASDTLDEFHLLFRSYLNRLYRIALILTGRQQSARELLAAIYLSAFENYSPKIGTVDFEHWLNDVLQEYLQGPSYRHFCLIESGIAKEPHYHAGFLN
ncbi:MAG TPA: hypothetical protein VGA99_03535 [bacterium]